MSADAIRIAVMSPMDWEQFERMVVEVLTQDDLPNLRKLGGLSDEGADATDERFYEDELRLETVVQITSQRAQKAKLSATLNRLSESNKTFRQLVIVYRHPVASDTRRAIQSEGAAEGISVDIRDESYLVTQLGRTTTGIFKRYFTDLPTQLNHLFSSDDILGSADDRVRRATLASIGAYVTNPASRITRNTFFDRAILAVLVAAESTQTFDETLAVMRDLSPEQHVNRDQLMSGLERLRSENLCTITTTCAFPTPDALESVGKALASIEAAVGRLRQHVVRDVAKRCRADDATKGRIERNVKLALMRLFRAVGPTVCAADDLADEISHEHAFIFTAIAEGLLPDVTRCTISSLNAFVRDKANAEVLAALARSYAACAIRNMDPLGRRFQQDALRRSSMLLDTDVLLSLLIEELPEHRAIKESLCALQREGVRLLVPNAMLEEATRHVSRAHVTYYRFAGSLDRLPEEFVDAEVWHAVVRGFYYLLKSGGKEGFFSYWQKYYNKDKPTEYACFVLRKHLPFELIEDVPLHGDDRETLDALLTEVLARKERKRWKAEFRDAVQMTERANVDVRCALHVARYAPDRSVPDAQGYLVSLDAAFTYMQRLEAWGNRPKVHIYTDHIMELAELASGVRLRDEDIVRLVFNPIHIAAAEQVADGIHELAKAGVDLRDESLYQLEWDVTNSLREMIFEHARLEKDPSASSERRLDSAIALSRAARTLGYTLDKGITPIVDSYETLKRELALEHHGRAQAEDFVKRLLDAAAGLSKKGRRRVNRLLREMTGLPVESGMASDDPS
jgi:hypothetical protein